VARNQLLRAAELLRKAAAAQDQLKKAEALKRPVSKEK